MKGIKQEIIKELNNKKGYIILLAVFCVVFGVSTGINTMSQANSIYSLFAMAVLPVFVASTLIMIIAPIVLKGINELDKKIKLISKAAKTLSTLCAIVLLLPLPIIATNAYNKANVQIAQDIVKAINKFENDNNRYPTNLNEIVPKYLPAIPRTILGQRFEYEQVDIKFIIKSNTGVVTVCSG